MTRELGWLFREQNEADQGIDAQVEIADDGHATGRLVALQIKTGKSYFKPVAGGWAFYYGERERTLWNNYALPVMVVLVDLERQVAYWQRISTLTERTTRKGFAVTVPKAQTLTMATEPWLLAAEGLDRIAHERWNAHLDALPPQVASILSRKSNEDGKAELVALHLANGRTAVAATADQLFVDQPLWMSSDDGWTWATLGIYCALHDQMLHSSRAFQIAAALNGPQQGTWLGIAALHSVEDATQARGLVKQALGFDDARIYVAITEAILEHPPRDALPLRTDKLIQIGGESVDSHATAQAFLAEQALRARDLQKAARHAERALSLDTDDTRAMCFLADVCMRRSATQDAQPDDVDRAMKLLRAAVQQLRRWSGNSRDALRALAKALMLAGEHDEALRWLLPAPHGTASPVETRDPDVLRDTLIAAHMAQSELTAWVIEHMHGDDRDRIVQLRLGMIQLSEEDQQTLWRTELDRAIADDDYEATNVAVLRLAELGIDKSQSLIPLIIAGIMPHGSEQLSSALSVLRRDPELALDRMRLLAAEDSPAADQLIAALTELDRQSEAAQACELAYERFREPTYLARRAMLLLQLEDTSAAQALRDALQANRAPAERARLATQLATLEAEAGNFPVAERLLSDILGLYDPPRPEAVWNVVRVQLAQGATTRAASTIARYRPTVTSADVAATWLNSMVSVDWDAAIVSTAIALAGQFKNEPRLATAILTHIVTSTRGTPVSTEDVSDEPEIDWNDRPVDDRPTVPGELHRKAFEVLGELIELHGDLTGAKMFRSESAEDALSQISELLHASALPDLSGILDQISRAILPVGTLALTLGKAYSLTLLHRSAGQLVSLPMDDAEYDLDVQTASLAMGTNVVIDLSSLLVLSALTDASTIMGKVASLIITRTSKEDVLRAAVEVQGLAASPGSIVWDSENNRPRLLEHTEVEYRRLRERTDAMERITRRAVVRDGRSPIFAESGLGEKLGSSPWIGTIEAADFESAALWCDDLSVRRLARSVGVDAFSTMALVEAFCGTQFAGERISDSMVEEIVAMRARVSAQLLAERVVDIPVTMGELLNQAADDDWFATGPAALVLSRPAWWRWHDEPITSLLHVYGAVREHRPEALRHWQYSAMLGLTRGLPLDSATEVLAALALLGWNKDLAPEPPFEDLVAGCENARRVAKLFNGMPDPMLSLPAAQVAIASGGVDRTEATVQALQEALGSAAVDS